jgi:hypothetical protein
MNMTRDFLLARCNVCGSKGTHRLCGKLKTVSNWTCDECTETEENIMTRGKQNAAEAKGGKSPSESAKIPTSKPWDINSNHTCSTPSDEAEGSYQSEKNPTKSATAPYQAIHSADDNEEEVDLSKVRISPSCKLWFPYTPQQMKNFQRRGIQVIPDWRGLKLTCNLVNWLRDSIEKSVRVPFSVNQ